MSIDMSNFLKKFNMRKIYKIISISLIFTAVLVFSYTRPSYSLRVPSSFQDGSGDFAKRSNEALKDIHGYVPTEERLRQIELVDRLINGTLTDEDKKTLEQLGIGYDIGVAEAPTKEIYDAIPIEDDRGVSLRVRASIERLTPAQRQVIVLYYYMGLNQAEIAKLYDLTRERVRQIEVKALKNLKIILERAGLNYNYIKISAFRTSL
jgi:RNA polymerase sigma factor (sigma-70 family)